MATWTLQSSSDDGEASISDGVSVWSETLGKFVLLNSDSGQTDLCLTSPDGEVWTGHGNPFTNEPAGWYGALALNDDVPLFVAAVRVSPTEGFNISSNGTTWTHPSNPFDSHANGAAACWSEDLGLWVAGNSGATPNTPLIMTSPDGSSWTGHTTPWDSINGKGVIGACWSPDLSLFCVCGESGGFGSGKHIAMTSPDGAVWTDTPTISSWDSAGLAYQVIWSTTFSCFVMVGADSTNIHTVATSSDGVTWANVPTDPFYVTRTGGSECYAVVDTGDAVWVGGATYSFASPAFQGPSVYSTTDLTTWTDEACPLDAQIMTLAYSPSLGRMMAFGLTSAGGQVELIATTDIAPPVQVAAYQRIYGWRASIDDNALETVDVLVSPQGGSE